MRNDIDVGLWNITFDSLQFCFVPIDIFLHIEYLFDHPSLNRKHLSMESYLEYCTFEKAQLVSGRCIEIITTVGLHCLPSQIHIDNVQLNDLEIYPNQSLDIKKQK